MGRMRKFRVGDLLEGVPVETINAHTDFVAAAEQQLAASVDPRHAKQKSPCLVRIAWTGSAPLAPGRAVMLTDVLFDEHTADYSPHEGLVLLADEFAPTGRWGAFAIVLEPCAAAGGGSTYQMATALVPNCYWAKVNVTDFAHQRCIRPTSGTLMESSPIDGNPIVWKEGGTGEKWAIVGLELGPVREQLAVVKAITEAGSTTGYGSTVDSTYGIHEFPVVELYLLVAHGFTDIDIGQKVLSATTAFALDVRREGAPQIGDVVRVWAEDGAPVVPGDSNASAYRNLFCDVVNVGDYLRGLSTFVTANYQVLIHQDGSRGLEWADVEDVVTTGGGSGGGGSGGDIVAEGYAIDITGTLIKTIHNNPAEWTDFAGGQMQIFLHFAGAAARTDPKWRTVSNYLSNKDQMWWHRHGVFQFQTTDDYDTSLPQQCISDQGNWKWVTATKLISFIFHSATLGAINAAAKVGGGPTILPTEITVEICEEDAVTHHLQPTGQTTVVQYRDGITLPQLSVGHVYAGEALQVYGARIPVVLSIYCKEWDE